MTAAQQTTAWEQAAATQKRMTALPVDAKDRMKVDTCAASARSVSSTISIDGVAHLTNAEPPATHRPAG